MSSPVMFGRRSKGLIWPAVKWLLITNAVAFGLPAAAIRFKPELAPAANAILNLEDRVTDQTVGIPVLGPLADAWVDVGIRLARGSGGTGDDTAPVWGGGTSEAGEPRQAMSASELAKLNPGENKALSEMLSVMERTNAGNNMLRAALKHGVTIEAVDPGDARIHGQYAYTDGSKVLMSHQQLTPNNIWALSYEMGNALMAATNENFQRSFLGERGNGYMSAVVQWQVDHPDEKQIPYIVLREFNYPFKEGLWDGMKQLPDNDNLVVMLDKTGLRSLFKPLEERIYPDYESLRTKTNKVSLEDVVKRPRAGYLIDHPAQTSEAPIKDSPEAIAGMRALERETGRKIDHFLRMRIALIGNDINQSPNGLPGYPGLGWCLTGASDIWEEALFGTNAGGGQSGGGYDTGIGKWFTPANASLMGPELKANGFIQYPITLEQLVNGEGPVGAGIVRIGGLGHFSFIVSSGPDAREVSDHPEPLKGWHDGRLYGALGVKDLGLELYVPVLPEE